MLHHRGKREALEKKGSWLLCKAAAHNNLIHSSENLSDDDGWLVEIPTIIGEEIMVYLFDAIAFLMKKRMKY